MQALSPARISMWSRQLVILVMAMSLSVEDLEKAKQAIAVLESIGSQAGVRSGRTRNHSSQISAQATAQDSPSHISGRCTYCLYWWYLDLFPIDSEQNKFKRSKVWNAIVDKNNYCCTGNQISHQTISPIIHSIIKPFHRSSTRLSNRFTDHSLDYQTIDIMI